MSSFSKFSTLIAVETILVTGRWALVPTLKRPQALIAVELILVTGRWALIPTLNGPQALIVVETILGTGRWALIAEDQQVGHEISSRVIVL